MIVQGPHPVADLLSGELLRSLQQLARTAGRTLEVCSCSGLRELVAHVRAARSRATEFMLLDPGELGQQVQAHPEAGLHDALDELTAPYIEVHDDSDATLEPGTCSHCAPLATIIINGDLATSYRIALGIALRRG
ncbi:MAG: type II 3-dehydroquinate dehydratase [Rhodanobacter sp.]